MNRMRPLCAVIALSVLSGCSSLSHTSATRSGPLANWDGLLDPPAEVARSATGRGLALDHAPVPAAMVSLPGQPNPFKPYSKEWWDIEESNTKIEEGRLARLMVICKGCLVDRDLIPAIKREATVAQVVSSAHLAPLDAGGSVRPIGEK